ncbi:transposase [Lactococcus hircilactis]
MFDSIMKELFLQAQDWESETLMPLKKGKRYELKVTYKATFKACPHCHKSKFHKHGTMPRKVQLTEYLGSPCFLIIAIQRYKCCFCGKVSTPELPESLVSKGTKDSVLLKKEIILKLKSKQSISEAARDLKVSPYSFYRLLNQMPTKDHFSFLTEVLCIDEFKATGDCKGKMAFIAMDGQTHKLVSLLDDRRLEHLVTYFLKFPRQVRLKVKFHVVQQLTRAFNQLRVQEMKQFDTHSPQYRHLKYYWNYLFKNFDDCSENRFYSRSLRQWTSSHDLVLQLKAYTPVLDEAWEVLQAALTAFRKHDDQKFFEIIDELKEELLPETFVKKFQFLASKKASIRLALHTPYSNGCVEGMNNKIKALKRVAFGFRRFSNFKKRIILMN